MDQRIRKLVMMHKTLYTRDDILRLYVSRKEGGKGSARIEDSFDLSMGRQEDYIIKSKGRL